MSAVNSLVSMERVRLLKGVKATAFLEADALPSFSLKTKKQNKKKPVGEGMICETNAVSVVLLLFLRQENILCFQFGKQCCPARKQKNLSVRLKQNVGFCFFSFAFSTQISRRSRQK